MRRWIILVAACSATPGPSQPNASIAPLSCAADDRMISVPAGSFIAGSTPEERDVAYDDSLATSGQPIARDNNWFDREQDRHTAVLPAFKLDLMPVTYAQYAEFVAAGMSPPPTRAQPAGSPDREDAHYAWHDGRPPSSREDHPVVFVGWSEADRYCRWRGEQRGVARRLPTAAEFEKAARGAGGLTYPWGNTFEPDKLNSAVRGPGDTVPAGAFAAGASAYGLLDMAGNVMQWTATPAHDGTMVVKGSAWGDFGGIGRGASRQTRKPEERSATVGFRCAGSVNAL